MPIYEFAIVATGLDPAADDYESRFYDHGCDDATVSFQKGCTIVDFAREASSLVEAIASAVMAVREAGGQVERIEPDPLVSLSDIATRGGLTRAAVSHYALGQRMDGFPPPRFRVMSATPLWDWPDVANWLCRQGKLSAEVVEEGVVIAAANRLLAEPPKQFATDLRREANRAKAPLHRA